MEYIWVAIGGAAGALIRFAVQNGLAVLNPAWPLGTIAVNGIGAFLIGVAMNASAYLPAGFRSFAVAGFLGAFTTYSAFAFEIVALLEQGRLATASIHWLFQACFSILFCYLGYHAFAR